MKLPEPFAASIDLTARVVYFPVRHHSPACAWHVERLIREVRPESVLIEGPRDASPLLPLLANAETRMPVAFYATYVRKRPGTAPDRFAAFYPLCEFSPEFVAVRVALELGANVRLIDLTFPESVEAQQRGESEHASRTSRSQSMQSEAWFSHSRLLRAACVRTGSRDSDDLWDHLYEVSYRSLDTAQFMQGVLTYCSLARRDATKETLKADGCLAREQAMAAEIADERGRTVVVTGGFHTVALPHTKPARPKPLKLTPEDNQMVLMRYSFEQLDRLNGYASGMPSPEFYQRVWEGLDLSQIVVEIARDCRRRNLGVSTADAIAAVSHAQRLAHLRGHQQLSREDLLDGIRSTFIKGADESEGLPVLALARKRLAGDRTGNVPAEAGQPPIVLDFRTSAQRLKLKLDTLMDTEAVLDLYRKSIHRDISRLFHRLTFLEIPFANFERGPDFVAGENLDRIQEVWTYCWSPRTESSLIERSLYGSTVEEAASNLLLERFAEAEQQGQGGRASFATQLVLHACRMGLHRHTQELLSRVGSLIAVDPDLDSLVAAMEDLLMLEVSREPLEAHHLSGLRELATTAYHRACFVIPTLAITPPEDEARMLEALNGLVQAVRTLGDGPELQQLRTDALLSLASSTGGSAAMRGGAIGLLYAEGRLTEPEIVTHLRGHLHSTREGGEDGPHFLRGLLKSARSVLWLVPGLLARIHEVLRDWDDEQFVRLLPLLRLAMADLTPRETDRVAQQVAAMLGTESLQLAALPDMTVEEMLRAVEVNRLVRATLTAEGLEVFGE